MNSNSRNRTRTPSLRREPARVQPPPPAEPEDSTLEEIRQMARQMATRAREIVLLTRAQEEDILHMQRAVKRCQRCQ